MNTDLPGFQTLGVTLVVLAASAILVLVHRELGPRTGLGQGGRWMLAGAFGLGVLAFSAKLLAMTLMLGLPEQTIRPLLSANRAPSTAPVPLASVVSPNGATSSAEPYVWQALPQEAPDPANNPRNPEKIALGKKLFHDKALSFNSQVSCASCHDVNSKGGGDGRATSQGMGGQVGSRNAPTVLNAAFQSALFWDGRAASLEEQAKGPLLNPIEMGMPSVAAVEKRVAADSRYRQDFQRAFGDGEIDINRIAEAIAAYERTLITPDTPYDRFVRGDREALTPAQLRGMALFESIGCVGCHSGPNFSAASIFEGTAPYRIFPATPTPWDERLHLTEDNGHGAKGGSQGVWRVPSLRNVALTAPYFHNGSVDSLEEAVRIMASAQLGRPPEATTGTRVLWSVDGHTLRRVERQPLSDAEIRDIVAFLHAISQGTSPVAGAASAAPRQG